jgi:hypothetical protein
MDRSATRFVSLIGSLIAGDIDAESEIVEFTRGIARQSPPEAGTDCTIPILEGLRWGLAKYGRNLKEGGRFFGSLKSVAQFLPNR